MKQNLMIHSAGFLILIFPAFLIAVPHGSSILLLLLLVSIIGLSQNREATPLQPQEQYFLYAVGLFVLVYAVNVGLIGAKTSAFDNASRFLLLLPVFFYLRKTQLNLNYFIFALFFGTLCCFIFATYQTYFLHLGRASGITNPAPFGGISITLGLMSLSVVLISSSKLLKNLMLLSFFFGLGASIMSETRGAWLALPVTLLVLLLLNPVNWKKQSRAIVSAILLVSLCAAYFLPAVQSRINVTISEFDNYINKGIIGNPIGLRVETWRAASISILENPVFGAGEGNFHQTIKQLADEGKIAHIIATHMAYAHNEYVVATFHRGIVGLLTLLLIFFLPLISFITTMKETSGNKKILALAGIILIISCMTMSLTMTFFESHNTTILYVMLIYFIYAQIYGNHTMADKRSGPE